MPQPGVRLNSKIPRKTPTDIPTIITLDGPAGSGKSAVAHLLAQKLGFAHLDTGAMYRAVALDAMEQGITDNPAAIAQRAAKISLDFDWSVQPAHILLNARDVAQAIRTPEVTRLTHIAADNPAVRAKLVESQRKIAQSVGSLVTEGRDQGTVVFPDAAYKFYLDADVHQRALRRVKDLAQKGITIDLAKMIRELEQRDGRDRTRSTGPLAIPDGAVIVDTTHLSLAEVVEELASRINIKPKSVAL